ncbi:MAG: hypothetical protein U5K74_03845 [Gemmatimonadaceae bacterium]|nr:hypothetical protein [Gemmatimonadaceae bacterium]
MAMLSVDLRSLEGQAVQLEGSIDPDDAVWLDGDVRPSSPVTVQGRLSGAGEGRYYFTGEFEGSAVGECTRCLIEVPVRAGDSIQCLFVSDDEDGLDDDPDVFLLDAKLALRPRPPSGDSRGVDPQSRPSRCCAVRICKGLSSDMWCRPQHDRVRIAHRRMTPAGKLALR